MLHLPAGRIADQFIDALSDRARKGVNVTIVVDAIGSFNLWGRPVRRLRKAGCRIESYQRLRWYSLARINNRTHRELLIIDGRIAFVGGAGHRGLVGVPGKGTRPPWRDTMARIEGPVVAALQGVAAENWLECCGEILTGPEYFPDLEPAGETTAFVVKSSPSDRATASRVAFQLLMEGADSDVHISTPYFLPDRAFRRALVDIARARRRGRVIVPGPRTDQRWVRLASRRMWGQLLEAGVRIFEYRGTMTHAKMLIVDEIWAVLGTTNIDNRSFEHNDEVNVAVRDRRGRGTSAGRLRARSAGQRGDHDRRVASPAVVGEGRRTVRLDPGAPAVTEPKPAGTHVGRAHRHLQHPSLPRHGSADDAVARRRRAARNRRRRRSRCRKSSAPDRRARARPRRSARRSAWAG